MDRQIRAASRQCTTAPNVYMSDIPIDKNSCVIVHKAPRIDASLEINIELDISVNAMKASTGRVWMKLKLSLILQCKNKTPFIRPQGGSFRILVHTDSLGDLLGLHFHFDPPGESFGF